MKNNCDIDWTSNYQQQYPKKAIYVVSFGKYVYYHWAKVEISYILKEWL